MERGKRLSVNYRENHLGRELLGERDAWNCAKIEVE
jgi:hypothetical protein